MFVIPSFRSLKTKGKNGKISSIPIIRNNLFYTFNNNFMITVLIFLSFLRDTPAWIFSLCFQMEWVNGTYMKLYPINYHGQDHPSGDSYIFACQHGVKECEGNKMTTCAKKLTQSEEVFMAFSNCVMREFTAAAAGPKVWEKRRFILYLSYTNIF